MYRDGSFYDKMAQLVIDVYLDYDIKGFPIDEKDVCRKLGIKLVPYSEYPFIERTLLKKRSLSGFYVPPSGHTQPMIFYNNNLDDVESYGSIRRNIFHEIKHYINGDLDENPEDDDLADYFGKYFMAPIPFLIYKRIEDINTIIADFGTDYTMATSIYKNIKNRKLKYGNDLFDYEIPLLKHLLGNDFKNGLSHNIP